MDGAVHEGRVKIASENTIDGLMTSIIKYRPKRILEIGSGIGTLTHTILSTMTSLELHEHEDYLFMTLEDNPFCLSQMAKNLHEYEGLYRVINSTNELSSDLEFDLIIVDGRGKFDDRKRATNFDDLLSRKGMIIVEGQRTFQRSFIGESYRNRTFVHVKMRSLKQNLSPDGTGTRNPRFKPYHVYLFEPGLSDRVLVPAKGFLRKKGAKAMRRLRSHSHVT
jgi:predicted O-methyltransferase YrrM